MKVKKHKLLVYLEEEIHEQLRVEAFETRTSMTRIINDVLLAHFRKQLKKRARKYV